MTGTPYELNSTRRKSGVLDVVTSVALRRDPAGFSTRIDVRPDQTRSQAVKLNIQAAILAFAIGIGLYIVDVLINFLVRGWFWGSFFLESVAVLIVVSGLLVIALYCCFIVAPVLALRAYHLSTSSDFEAPAIAKTSQPIPAHVTNIAPGNSDAERLASSLTSDYQVADHVGVLEYGTVRARFDHIVTGPAGIWVVDRRNWSGRTAADGAGGIAGPPEKQNQLESIRRNSDKVKTGVAGIIIAVTGGTVENRAFVVPGTPEVVVIEDAYVAALLLDQKGRGRWGVHIPMEQIDAQSPNLHFD